MQDARLFHIASIDLRADFNVTFGRRPMRALRTFTMSATLDNQGVQPVTALARLAWLLSTGGNQITMTWSPKDSGEDGGGKVGRCHNDDDGHCTTRTFNLRGIGVAWSRLPS